MFEVVDTSYPIDSFRNSPVEQVPEVDLYGEPEEIPGPDAAAFDEDFAIGFPDYENADLPGDGGEPPDPDSGDTSPSSDNGDVPPPQDPPAETGQPEMPARARALQSVLDFSVGSTDQIEGAVFAHITQSDEYRGRLDDLVESGITAQDAIDVLATEEVTEDGPTLTEALGTQELMLAQVQYENDLQATGLELILLPEENHIAVGLVNPEAFTAALSEVPTPAGEPVPHTLGVGITSILRNTLPIIGHTLVALNSQNVEAMYGGEMPPIPSLFEKSDGSIRVPQEFTDQIAELAAYARPIAENLRRIGMQEGTVANIHRLAAAYEEGLLAEWGAATALSLIGDSREIGIQRMGTDKEWSAAYGFLHHMESMAPDSQLLQLVRTQVIEDLERALAPHEPIEAITDEVLDEDDLKVIAFMQVMRSGRRGRVRPMLEQALLRFRAA